MSILARAARQVDTRSKLLLAVYGDSGFTPLKLANTIAANPSAIVSNLGTVLNTTEAGTFIGNTGYGRSYDSGDLFRDLGKELIIQTNGRTDYVYRLVQTVKGRGSEGVPENAGTPSLNSGNFYICVWNADNTSNSCANSANVVRVG